MLFRSDETPTPAPTNNCDFYDLSFDEKALPKGTYVSLQWKELGMRISASQLAPGTGGFIPGGNARLFNTSEPVDVAGFGTPGLAADLGNVLIVQQTGGNAQPKANELGGVITFDFIVPVNEVVEIGVLNVVEEVIIQVSDDVENTDIDDLIDRNNEVECYYSS